MNGEKLLECLEFLDDDLITEAAAVPKKANAHAALLRNAAFAASFVLLLGTAFLLPKLLLRPDTPIAPVSTTLTDVPSTSIPPVTEHTVTTALTAEP